MQICFWILLLSILRLFPLNFGQQNNGSNTVVVVPCQSNGIWGDWSNWTACPTSPFLFALSSLNVQQRIRPCLPQPTGCQLPPSSSIAPFNCTGSYSDVRACPTPNAVDKIVNPISAIPQFGSLPQQQITISGIGGAGFGSAWTATMLQSMQIGGNNLGNLNAGMLQTMQINGTGGK